MQEKLSKQERARLNLCRRLILVWSQNQDLLRPIVIREFAWRGLGGRGVTRPFFWVETGKFVRMRVDGLLDARSFHTREDAEEFTDKEFEKRASEFFDCCALMTESALKSKLASERRLQKKLKVQREEALRKYPPDYVHGREGSSFG